MTLKERRVGEKVKNVFMKKKKKKVCWYNKTTEFYVYGYEKKFPESGEIITIIIFFREISRGRHVVLTILLLLYIYTRITRRPRNIILLYST